MSDAPEPAEPMTQLAESAAQTHELFTAHPDLTPRFASGGTIAPPPDDSDSVPALLERGCAYIIVRDETGHGECG